MQRMWHASSDQSYCNPLSTIYMPRIQVINNIDSSKDKNLKPLTSTAVCCITLTRKLHVRSSLRLYTTTPNLTPNNHLLWCRSLDKLCRYRLSAVESAASLLGRQGISACLSAKRLSSLKHDRRKFSAARVLSYTLSAVEETPVQ